MCIFIDLLFLIKNSRIQNYIRNHFLMADKILVTSPNLIFKKSKSYFVIEFSISQLFIA